jgi:hypothetical protein
MTKNSQECILDFATDRPKFRLYPHWFIEVGGGVYAVDIASDSWKLTWPRRAVTPNSVVAK